MDDFKLINYIQSAFIGAVSAIFIVSLHSFLLEVINSYEKPSDHIETSADYEQKAACYNKNRSECNERH